MSEGRQRRTRREESRAAISEAEERSTEAAAPEEATATVISTNSVMRLTCTLAAMCSLFALFLCYAEKRSRVIRSYAVQSVALTVVHLACGLALAVVGGVLGAIPFLGFLINLICWLVYLAIAVALVVVRVRMMLAAWQGARYKLPLIGHATERFL